MSSNRLGASSVSRAAVQQLLPQQVRRVVVQQQLLSPAFLARLLATNFKIVGVALQRQPVGEGAAEEKEDVAIALRLQTVRQKQQRRLFAEIVNKFGSLSLLLFLL